jgi:hypothetical protein
MDPQPTGFVRVHLTCRACGEAETLDLQTHAITPERLHRIWRRCAACLSCDLEIAEARKSVKHSDKTHSPTLFSAQLRARDGRSPTNRERVYVPICFGDHRGSAPRGHASRRHAAHRMI